MAWPAVYTYNFCPNPSFEFDLTGVSALSGASVLQDPSMALYGTQSLNVSTPGQVTGEGVALPPGAVLATSGGAVSFYLQGNSPTASGTLSVLVLDTTSSTTLGSATVSFSPATSWQRVVISGLSLVNAHSITVWVTTTTPQITSFNIDAVQYDAATSVNGGTLPTPYIDGDQPFASWVGTPEESASSKPYQNQIGAIGDILTAGQGSLLVRGAVFNLVFSDPASGPTTVPGGIDLSGVNHAGLKGSVIIAPGGSVVGTNITTLLMFAGLNDFGIWQPGDADPAMSLVNWNNAGVSVGTNTSGNAGYTRPFATFSAPQAFQGSLGVNLWNTAAYHAVGYQLASQANNGAQNITHVQSELVPNNGSQQPVPSTYQRARALTATLAPTEMNYVVNPSFETDTTGWTAIPSTTLTRVASPGWTGSAYATCSGTSTYTGAWITVQGLIVGETYTVSGYVEALTSNVSNIQVLVSLAASGVFLYQGGIPGFSLTTPMTQNTWQRVSVQFVAPASNTQIGFWGTHITGNVATLTIGLDGVMLNPGGLVTYGDGNSSGWAWEGTANETRSYYYQRANVAYAEVVSILAQHLPYGQHAYDPVYFTPVTQYSS